MNKTSEPKATSEFTPFNCQQWEINLLLRLRQLQDQSGFVLLNLQTGTLFRIGKAEKLRHDVSITDED